MGRRDRASAVREGLDAERSLILGLGGYSLGLAGGTLVLHERIAVPRFNFVQVERLSPSRVAGFFERALDQYFQRAIRPSFRVPAPAPPHVHRTLAHLGFRARAEPLVLLGRESSGPRARAIAWTIRSGSSVGTDAIVPFWVAPRDAAELASALEILRHHPNPGETVLPVLGMDGEQAVAAALVYARGANALIFGVSTVPTARGRGAATALVQWVRRHPPVRSAANLVIFSDSRRLERRLKELGFQPWARWTVYELQPDSELSMPVAPPSGGPLWRPPRAAGAASA